MLPGLGGLLAPAVVPLGGLVVARVVPQPDNGVIPVDIGETVIMLHDHGGKEVGGVSLLPGGVSGGCCTRKRWGWAAGLQLRTCVGVPGRELPRLVDGRQGELLDVLELAGVEEGGSVHGLGLVLCSGRPVKLDPLWTAVDDLLQAAPDRVFLLTACSQPGVVPRVAVSIGASASCPIAPPPSLCHFWCPPHLEDPPALSVAPPPIADAEIEEHTYGGEGDEDHGPSREARAMKFDDMKAGGLCTGAFDAT